MATGEVTLIPIGREGAGLSDVLAEVARHLASQETVEFEMRAMGTELEGDVHDILTLVGEIQEIPLMLGLPRVYTVLKLDNRVDRDQGLSEKVEAVEQHLREGETELPGRATPPE
ncbi:MAG: MTH1187 family thiamine-binding protein [Solirubrobacterales bacterium]